MQKMAQLLRKHFVKVITNRILINECLTLNTNRYINCSLPVLGIKGTPIKMPSLSPTMTEGTIVKWIKREGDKISPGDVLCEVQTDKAVVGLELEEEGILAKIVLPEDTKDIQIGTLIAVMVETGQDWKDVDIPADTAAKAEQKPAENISKIDDQTKESKKIIHNLISPSARNLLHRFGIDSQMVISSGPRNTLLKQDVLSYIKSKQLQPKPLETQPITEKPDKPKQTQATKESAFIDIELSNMRKTIAKRLTQSKSTIPHSYMNVNCSMNGVSDTRKKLKQSSATNVSVNDFIIKAASIALKKVPQINCSWIEETSSLQLLPNIDISVAVATPTGLITPIVKNANKLSLEEINKTVKELAEKAKQGKLQPQEFIGGSFSISNLGMFGITDFTAVINPPQCAILAIGTSRLLLDENDQLCQVMTATLSFDSRAIDEEDAAKFLASFKSAIENVDTLQNSDGSDNRRLYALIS